MQKRLQILPLLALAGCHEKFMQIISFIFLIPAMQQQGERRKQIIKMKELIKATKGSRNGAEQHNKKYTQQRR